MKIPLLRPTLPPFKAVEKKLKDTLESGMLSEARYVREFERKAARHLGVQYVAACSSGTAALTLALLALGIKDGEVIIPSFTYSSDGHVLLWVGLEPAFADINAKTLNLDPASIEKNITTRTKAIMPTHIFGNPCDVDAIGRIAKKHSLQVIYDATHAFGSTYRGKSVMAYGDASVISFTPTKVLTTGEGGMVVGQSKEFIEKVAQGKYNGDSFKRESEFLGITARMGEWNAILGIEGLKILPRHLRERMKLVALYKRELGAIPGIAMQEIEPHGVSNYKDFVIFVDKNTFGVSRDELLEMLRKHNIETKVYFYPLHKKKMYTKFAPKELPNTELVAGQIMNLPLYSHMPEAFVRKVCLIIKKAYRKQ